jgi:hypothetical protein
MFATLVPTKLGGGEGTCQALGGNGISDTTLTRLEKPRREAGIYSVWASEFSWRRFFTFWATALFDLRTPLHILAEQRARQAATYPTPLQGIALDGRAPCRACFHWLLDCWTIKRRVTLATDRDRSFPSLDPYLYLGPPSVAR